MSKQRQAEKKRKTRERVAAAKRLKTAATNAEARQKAKKQYMIEKMFGEKQQPYVRPEKEEVVLGHKRDEIRQRMEANVKALQALLGEHDAEVETRKEVNRQLEEEGYATVEEKVRALAEKSRQIAEETEPESGENAPAAE